MTDYYNISDRPNGETFLLKSIADPGAGNDAAWTFPEYTEIMLLNMRFVLTLSAVAASRVLSYNCENLTAKKFVDAVSDYSNAVISQPYYHNWGIGDAGGNTQQQNNLNWDHSHLPPLWVPGSFTHRISSSAMDGGDTLTEIEIWFKYRGLIT